MTTVIGLDLSLTAAGIAYPDGSATTIKTRLADGDRRLLHIAAAVTDALDPHTTLAVIEDLPTHARSAGITGMVHGAVRAALLEHEVPYVLLAPATLKAYATGKGNGDKTAMAMAAYKRAGVEFADDNACDAWWCRAAGLDQLGAPVVALPQAQRDRLSKAAWPVLIEQRSA
ncbi:MAG TPA: Holliday junction endonuclease [Streptomyces sp.]